MSENTFGAPPDGSYAYGSTCSAGPYAYGSTCSAGSYAYSGAPLGDSDGYGTSPMTAFTSNYSSPTDEFVGYDDIASTGSYGYHSFPTYAHHYSLPTNGEPGSFLSPFAHGSVPTRAAEIVPAYVAPTAPVFSPNISNIAGDHGYSVLSETDAFANLEPVIHKTNDMDQRAFGESVVPSSRLERSIDPRLAQHADNQDGGSDNTISPNTVTDDSITPKKSTAQTSPTTNASNTNTDDLHFANFKEVTKSDKEFLWKLTQHDISTPLAEDEIRVYVKKLVAAIRNNQGCKSKESNVRFVKRWADGSTFYDNAEIEKLAWRLVMAMIDIHTKGWNFPIYDAELKKSILMTASWTFENRFGAVEKLLTHSKSTCETLLKNEKFYTILGLPGALEARTTSNQVSNQRKEDRIRKGTMVEQVENGRNRQVPKKAKASRRKRVRTPDSDIDADYDVDADYDIEQVNLTWVAPNSTTRRGKKARTTG